LVREFLFATPRRAIRKARHAHGSPGLVLVQSAKQEAG
jgi:hypothetical protein